MHPKADSISVASGNFLGAIRIGFDSEKPYVQVQIRVMPGHGLRIQTGKSAESDTKAVLEFLGWLAKVPAMRESVAGTGTKYAGALARVEDASQCLVRIQVPGTPLNRWYGACVIVKAPMIVSLLSQILKG